MSCSCASLLYVSLMILPCLCVPLLCYQSRAFTHLCLYCIVTHVLHLVSSFCHGKSEGPYHLLKCIHGAPCCQMLQVSKDDLLGFVSVKCICVRHNISIPSCIHPISSMIGYQSIDSNRTFHSGET